VSTLIPTTAAFVFVVAGVDAVDVGVENEGAVDVTGDVLVTEAIEVATEEVGAVTEDMIEETADDSDEYNEDREERRDEAAVESMESVLKGSAPLEVKGIPLGNTGVLRVTC